MYFVTYFKLWLVTATNSGEKYGHKNVQFESNLVNLVLITLTAKLFNLNFHQLEVVSRWRDSQL